MGSELTEFVLWEASVETPVKSMAYGLTEAPTPGGWRWGPGIMLNTAHY